MKVRNPSLRNIPGITAAEGQSSVSGQPRGAHGIPDPRADIDALYQTVVALKEQVEILSRQRGFVDDGALFVKDLEAIRRLVLYAPTGDEQYALLNQRWTPLGYFKPLAKEPRAPIVGRVAYANGTSWNPGSGAGLYVYKPGGWVFIA